MKTVVTIGGATQDIFIHYEDDEYNQLHSEDNRSFLMLEEGTKVEIKNLQYVSGGGATNSAAGFTALGYNTHIFCKLGPDSAGEFIMQELKKNNIQTDLVLQTSKKQTGTSFIIPSPSGNRTIFVYRGANNTLQENEIPHDALAQSNGIYITSLSGESSHLLPTIARHAKKNGGLIANNPGKGQLMGDIKALEQALTNIDFFILNTYESRILLSTISKDPECIKRLLEYKKDQSADTHPTLFEDFITLENNCLSLRHYFKEILQRGPKIVIVTNGSEGVYAATQDKLYFHKALPTEVINTVGAGDLFGSCFFGSILQGYDIETALAFGALNSSSVLSTPNAKTGLLSFKELEERRKNLSTDLLQTFDW